MRRVIIMSETMATLVKYENNNDNEKLIVM